MRAEVAMKVTGFFATVLILGTWSAAARASTDNWNGDGGDNKWSDAENWQGGTAPVNGAALVFSGTMRLTPVNDIADLSLSMITFDGTAGSFTLSGNAINSLTFITSNSSQTQTLSLPITATTGVTVTASAGAVDLIGALSGGGLTKTGTGTLVLAATNTYTGPTTISQGNLLVSGAGQHGRQCQRQRRFGRHRFDFRPGYACRRQHFYGGRVRSISSMARSVR